MDLTCDEANRYVYDAVIGMKMTVTGFKLAKPGIPGYVRATRTTSAGTNSGTVNIDCSAGGVRIQTDEDGLAGDKVMTRGVYLSVTGRAGLSKPDPFANKNTTNSGASNASPGTAGDSTGVGGTAAASSPSDGSTTPAAATEAASPNRGGLVRERREVKQEAGVSVKLVPVRGFATVLDFEADLSAAGVLPIKVTIFNNTRRTYEFDPADIILRKAGSRSRSKPLTPGETVSRLREANRVQLTTEQGAPPADPLSPSQLGDIGAAIRIVDGNRLGTARLRAGGSTSGYLYYALDNYDRARVTMIDVATGETEGFIVEF